MEPPDFYDPPPAAPDIDKAVAAEARKFLTSALAECRRLGIIPKVRRRNRWERFEGPWPPYYAWYDIADRDALAAGFIAALRAAYPARFGEESKFPYKDPEQYVRAFLSAVIAGGTIQEGRVAARSRAATAMLHELHRSVSQEGQTFGCPVADRRRGLQHRRSPEGRRHHAAAAHQPARVAGVAAPAGRPVGSTTTAHPMPGATRRVPLRGSGTGPATTGTSPRRSTTASGRFMQTLRLATAATSVERMVWLGRAVDDPCPIPRGVAAGRGRVMRDVVAP